MTTYIIPILGVNTMPDDSGAVYFQSYAARTTNDTWPATVCMFADTATRVGLHGLFRVPGNYVGTPKIVVDWSAAVTTGDVEWDFDYRAVGGNDAESMDQTGVQESVNLNDTAPSAVNNRLTVELALTAANIAAGDLVQFKFFRDGSDAGDTMASTAAVFGLYFSYTDV